jgi:tRNA uridine 5-carboxymethylaminomethyl modification enzyme
MLSLVIVEYLLQLHQKQIQQVEHYKKLESRLIPEDIDYEKIDGLRLEARQKLSKIRPKSVGQATRITGVSPADMNVLLIYLQMNK